MELALKVFASHEQRTLIWATNSKVGTDCWVVRTSADRHDAAISSNGQPKIGQ
jgi:hypothetical protein